MIDGIVVQPATGHWCTVGRPSKVAAGRSLPSLSLAGISPGNRGRLAILHTKRAGTCSLTIPLRETEVLSSLGSPLNAGRHQCGVNIAISCLHAQDLELFPRHVTGRSLCCCLSTLKANSMSRQK